MAESRLAQLSTSPLLTNFAITASQKAIQPVGQFLAPLCEVPDITFRAKVYTDHNRFRIPSTKRAIGSKATRLGFTADDKTFTLEPNALDFPIPNVNALSDQALSYSIMEGQSILADASGLALENEIISLAVTTLTAGATNYDWTSGGVDPISLLDDAILSVIKASKNGAPIKILFGATAFKKIRNNTNVRGRFVIGAGKTSNGGAGTIAPTIGDIAGMLITNPEVKLSMMVQDTSGIGQTESISFLLDNKTIIFAANDTPNRMDPSFMKTFAPMGGFFKPGSYVTEDQRDEVLKMDWTTLPAVTNSPAALMLTNS